MLWRLNFNILHLKKRQYLTFTVLNKTFIFTLIKTTKYYISILYVKHGANYSLQPQLQLTLPYLKPFK